MDWLYCEFGKRLKKARKQVGLTQDSLAERVGLSRASITNIELGRQHVALHSVFLLASALGITPRQLLPEQTQNDSNTTSTPLNLLRSWPGLAKESQQWITRIVASNNATKEIASGQSREVSHKTASRKRN